MKPSPSEPLWLIRRQDLRVFRPIPQRDLVRRIAAGEIAPNDELCPANGYWFLLSEVDEVRRHLGDVDLSCLHPKDGETTSSTDTRPIQKTKLISQSRPTEHPPAQPVPQAPPPSSFDLSARRARNLIGVAVFFLIFLAILVLFWLGSY